MSDTAFFPRPAVSQPEGVLWPELNGRPGPRAASRRRTGADDAIREQLRAGDANAAAQLIERFHPNCRKLARALAHDDEYERALTEEMLFGVLRALRRARRVESMDRLAARVATAVGIERAHGPKGAARLSADQLEPEERQFFMNEASFGCFDADLQSRFARRLFRKILAGLQPEERLVCALVELEGWSLQKVARQAGWSMWRTRWRAFFAYRKFNRTLRSLMDTVRA